ncbi:2'-5' RNA ligase family protein [Ancylomarina salipaludis]|uniref:2'-5' RNA ligase family protein n=1 Tax=Ancylomarina salipaludis TaxID=2501299 RepID=A0A4Q1JJT4_9BACT|nr:2'-5' RNA ligase family protein [Ancylomarina salipaludis]RXQ91543.1 2'-5' RNA ligase family protein [Ancylomarina salipaludis]
MPNQQRNLYFIALVPHSALRERVENLKKEMKDSFNAKHALKSPAHITLQMPFRSSTQTETKLIQTLEEFARQQDTFEINLSGFDCFEPRVIFIKISDHTPILSLHAKLIPDLANKIEIGEKEISQNIHPHMTIATRDLSTQNFNKAWSKFKNREFKASFLCKSLFLLKHNGSFWDIYQEFLFKKQ